MYRKKKKKINISNRSVSLNLIEKRIKDELMEDRRALAMSLYKELVFMNDTLSKLREDIKKNGINEDFKNGKQDFIRESPSLKTYNITIKNYNKTVRDLLEILPPPKEKPSLLDQWLDD